MDYVIIGGDERFAWLARLLARRGEAVGTLGREPVDALPELGAEALRRAKKVIVNYPPRLSGLGMTFEELLADVPAAARVYSCGPWHPRLGPNGADLWQDEALIQANARLTAEGALAAAMRGSSLAIGDMTCLVVGWGRIGRALTELLVGLGARVLVATRSEHKRNQAAERGAEGVLTRDLAPRLGACRLIVNTAPAMTLDGAMLEAVDPEAMLMDLASAPYGIDLSAAWQRGLRAWREPGLPGRYCPESAALALLSAMDREEGRRAR